MMSFRRLSTSSDVQLRRSEFWLISRPDTATLLKEFLALEHGILIRDASNFEGLDSSYFRIAVQTPQENDELIKALKQWSKQ